LPWGHHVIANPNKKNPTMNCPQNLQELVSMIKNELGTDKGLLCADVDIEKIKLWMSSYESNAEDWKKYALW
jgi:hypothetical protein